MSNRWRYLNKDWSSEFTYPHGIFLYLNIQIMLWFIFFYVLTGTRCNLLIACVETVRPHPCWTSVKIIIGDLPNPDFQLMHSETLSYLYKTNYKIKMWLQRTLSLASSSMSDFSTWQFSIFSATDILVHTKCCHGALIYNTKAHFFCCSFLEM